MAVFLERRMLLGMKVEVTEGTAVAITGADADLLIYDVKFEADVDQFDRQPIATDKSPYSSIPGNRKARCTFKVECKGSGTAGTAPKVGKILKMCEFGETVTGGVSAVYAPISIGSSSYSLALYSVPESGNNIKALMRGCRATARLPLTSGQPGMFEVDVQGVYDGVTDAAGLTASGLETTLPPAFLNAALSIQAFTPKVSQFSLDLGNVLQLRTDVNKAEGFFSCLITDKMPKGSFDPEKELVATHDYYGKLISAAEGALTLALGATAGNICTITAPKLQYTAVKEGGRNGIAVFNVDYKLNRNAGNDEVVLTFT